MEKSRKGPKKIQKAKKSRTASHTKGITKGVLGGTGDET